VRTVTLILLSVLLFASCASYKQVDQQTFDTAPLFGMIYDEDNQPCAGVQLTVDGTAGPVTDIRGRFVVPDLPRGDHGIVARKEKYEDLALSISFLNRTDVLHLTMTSFGQLLGSAQKSISDMRWSEAGGYLERAERLDGEDAVLRYLFAIVAWKTADFPRAVNYLTAILAAGTPQPAVYLFLADIYQNDLDDPAKAIASLESYLRLRADPETAKRLGQLKDGQAKRGG